MLKASSEKKQLLRWCIWFFLANVFLAWLFSLNYLRAVSWLDFGVTEKDQYGFLLDHIHHVLNIFTALTYSGQLALLVFALGSAVSLLVLFLPRKIIVTAAVLAMSLLLIFLLADSLTYYQYRYHLNGIILSMALHAWDQSIFDFSRFEIFCAVLSVCGIILIESVIAYLLLKKQKKINKLLGFEKWAAAFFAFCLYGSFAMFFLNSTQLVSRVLIDTAHIFPGYSRVVEVVTGSNQTAMQTVTQMYTTQAPQASSPLQYPLHPLQFGKTKSLNVVFIVIDAWRFDMLNTDVTPNIFKFAQKTWQFKNHFSGGDATGPGIFTLFYGVPAGYWTSVATQKKSPILLEEFFKRHYRVGIFSSANLGAPPLNMTVFQGVSDLHANQQEGKTPDARDQQVTEKFLQFIKNNQQPFFTFLFYDAAHGYCDVENPAQPFQPEIQHCARAMLNNQSDPVPYLNRYKNALMLVDLEVKKVLAGLEKQHLLENTVVVVTGDHGEEFNDNRMNYWSHASNYTRYQVQTPLLVYWPHEKPRELMHQTSHFDIAPTLMRRVFDCQNPTADYSVGQDLFDQTAKPYLIVNSYVDFGVIQRDRVTRILAGGKFNISDLNARLIPGANLDFPVMTQVFGDLGRFYVKD